MTMHDLLLVTYIISAIIVTIYHSINIGDFDKNVKKYFSDRAKYPTNMQVGLMSILGVVFSALTPIFNTIIAIAILIIWAIQITYRKRK